jgi:RimJ/RimL family protein N-acetyltransferase
MLTIARATDCALLLAFVIEQGCARYQWQVLDWNTPSIGFYEALGARPLPEWITMRLEGAALATLGGS